MTAPRVIDRPKPGFYRVRLAKGAPWVAARIAHVAAKDPLTGETLDRSPLWCAYVNEEPLADPSPDWVTARVDRIWIYGRPIDVVEYRFLLAQHRHAVRHEPNHPAANPRRPVDHMKTPPAF